MRLEDVEQLRRIRREVEAVAQTDNRETQLLHQLLEELKLPPAQRSEFLRLEQLRSERSLNADEHTRLKELIAAEEKLRVERIARLIELAEIRKTTPVVLARELQLEQIGDE